MFEYAGEVYFPRHVASTANAELHLVRDDPEGHHRLKILTGGKAEDTRSDDEDVVYEIVDEDEVQKKSRQMNVTDLNVCVGSGSEVSSEMTGMSAMTTSNPRVTTGRRRLMDAENRKALLARIGCDKPI
jgi:hypothetical protein